MKMNKYIILFLVALLLGSTAVVAQSKEKQTMTLTGVVKSAETKLTLQGIRVSYNESDVKMTDADGKFSIQLPSLNVNLYVSGPGCNPKLVAVKGQKNLIIFLNQEDAKTIFANLMAPQGDISPVSLTSSWATSDANNILSTAVTGDDALQGKIAGLNVMRRSGMPGAGSNMYIRGLNTLNAGAQPLIIVDGMPYENSSYSTSLVGNYFSNPLASIDVKDIESGTVLKDGTSQYGVKGANGVILINTLRPKQMETKINFHYHTGVNFTPVEMPLLSASDHKLLLSDILQSQGRSGSQISALPYMNSQKPTLQKWGYDGNVDYYRYNNNTNWQKQVFTPSYNQDYYLNVFGGDEVAIYALSLGYLNQKGIVDNTGFQRFNTRFNAEVNLSKKLKLNANMSFLFSSKDLGDEGPLSNRNPIFAALVKSPFMAANVFSAEGLQSPVVENVDIFNRSNPYTLVNTSSINNSQFRFVGNFAAQYIFNKYLKINGSVGVNFNKEREKVYFPTRGVYFDTLSIGAVDNLTQHRVDRIFSIFEEGVLTYDRNLTDEHRLTVRLGARNQTNHAEDDWASTANTGSDDFKSITYGNTLFQAIGGQISNWNWLNIFGTVDYGYQGKYFINYTTSADASSRYGANANTFCIYPSVSGAWLISSESFMKNSNAFDLLKLRVGYGLSGNDEIGNYNGRQYYVPQNILGNYGLVRGNLVDLNLKPEISKKLNAGMDAAFFNERLNLSIDVYKTHVEDMILRMPAPRATGFATYLTNAGKMTNTGIDLSVNYRVLNGNLKWDLGLNAATYKNRVTDLGGQQFSSTICNATILTQVGQPVGVFYGYKTNGVYATQQQALADGLGIQKGSVVYPFGAGDVRFVNTDASNKLIDENDKVIIGDPNPDVYGSVSSSLKYKGWTLDALFTYSVGNDVYNYTRSQLESMSGYDNQTQAVINRWRTEGDITNIPHAIYGDPMGNARFSDRWIEDGSYLRLKTLTLAYNLQLKSNLLRACTIFASADNILTITGYKGLDPEFSYGQNVLSSGIDATATPFARTVSVGVKLDL